MPIKKPQLHIQTSYFDEQTNSIFKESLQQSSSQQSNFSLDRNLTNSKSSPDGRGENILFKTILPVEKSPNQQRGPQSQRLLEEFRQIVDRIPQITSEIYESVSVFQSNVNSNCQQTLKTKKKQGLSNQTDAGLQIKLILGANSNRDDSKHNLDEHRKGTPIDSLLQSQQCILSVNAISQYKSAIYGGSNRQIQMQMIKNNPNTQTHSVIVQEVQHTKHYEHQNQSSTLLKKKYEFVTRGPAKKFRQFSVDSKLLKTVQNSSENTKKQYLQINHNKRNQDKLIFQKSFSGFQGLKEYKYQGQNPQVKINYQKSNSSENLQIHSYARNPYNRQGLQRSYSIGKIQRIKQNYNENLQRLRLELKNLTNLNGNMLYNLDEIQAVYQTKLLKQQRIKILREIWSKLNKSPYNQGYLENGHICAKSSSGRRIKNKLYDVSPQKIEQKLNLKPITGNQLAKTDEFVNQEMNTLIRNQKLETIKSIEQQIKNKGAFSMNQLQGKQSVPVQKKKIKEQNIHKNILAAEYIRNQAHPNLLTVKNFLQLIGNLKGQIRSLKKQQSSRTSQKQQKKIIQNERPHYITEFELGKQFFTKNLGAQLNPISFGATVTPIKKIQEKFQESGTISRNQQVCYQNYRMPLYSSQRWMNGPNQNQLGFKNSVKQQINNFNNFINNKAKETKKERFIISERQRLSYKHVSPIIIRTRKEQDSLVSTFDESSSTKQYYPYTRNLILEELQKYDKR